MYQKGDYIVYNNNGVCVVENVTTLENAFQTSADKLYYELRSTAKNGGVSYVPIDSLVFMRPVMSKSDAKALVEKIPQIPSNSYVGTSVRDASRVYRDAINTHDSEVIIGLIKHLLDVDRKKREQNKKLSSTEEYFLTQARRIIESELSNALDMSEEEVAEYIQKHI